MTNNVCGTSENTHTLLRVPNVKSTKRSNNLLKNTKFKSQTQKKGDSNVVNRINCKDCEGTYTDMIKH